MITITVSGARSSGKSTLINKIRHMCAISNIDVIMEKATEKQLKYHEQLAHIDKLGAIIIKEVTEKDL